MKKPLFDYKKWMDAQVSNILATCLVTSMEVLKDNFKFNQDDLQKFADGYTKLLESKIKPVKNKH
jgi:hypothetical protein